MRVLVLKRRKVDKAKSRGLNLPNGKLMKTIGEEGYKCLGILECDKAKEKEMKAEFVREYKREKRLKLILRSKLNGQNKIKAINCWAVAMRYGAGVLEWRFDELTEFDRKNWKLFTIHKGLPPKSDIDRLYDSRKEGGRGLVKCGSTIGSEENNVG